MSSYENHCLQNGLRIIHLPSSGPVSYCGFAINTGSRDELASEYGMAHFVEHMLFKGTRKRKTWHILNRMENVGGELNAYTSKEDTFLYTSCLAEDTGRAIELLSDIAYHSTFPEKEIKKELEVVLDEINSYKDNPSELIFDEFENLVFEGHPFGHNILGDKKSLKQFRQSKCLRFVHHFYRPENMVFFSYGKTPFSKILKLVEKYTGHQDRPGHEDQESQDLFPERVSPEIIPVRQVVTDKKLYQSHVMIGGRAYDLHHGKRMGLYLLNNILGGPGMNSRLNLSLREKHGLVYQVESGLTSYSDTGVISIYFGTDPKTKDRCIELALREINRLRNEKLKPSQLVAAKKQLKGQLGVASDHRENIALGMGKSFLHLNRYDNLPQIYAKIEAVTSDDLIEIAREILSEDKLFQLIYT